MRQGPMTSPPSTPRATLLYEVKRLELAVRAKLDEVLKPRGVSVSQYTAITVLEHRNDVTSAALARRSFVTAQAMGDVVMALERRGLVVRHRDPAHARRLTIALTAAGRMLLAEVREDVAKVEIHMTRSLSAENCDHLRQLLSACVHNLTTDDADDHQANTRIS